MPSFITQLVMAKFSAKVFASSSTVAKKSPVTLRCSDVFHSNSQHDSVRLVGTPPSSVKQSNINHAFGSVSQHLTLIPLNNESCNSMNDEFHLEPETVDSSTSVEVNYLRTKESRLMTMTSKVLKNDGDHASRSL